MRFADMPLPETLKRALATRGYEESTPVQEAIVIGAHGERDLLVSSKTGSGKTVAFGLSMLAPLLNEAGVIGAPAGAPFGLVIAPTRELAQQVARELAWLSAEAGIRVACCVGGTDARGEAQTLRRGAHIVAGTPGRLLDHITRGALETSAMRCVVLDEADEMLDMGFREELEGILDATPKERRTLLFSATLPRETIDLASKYTKDAVRLTAAQQSAQHEDIEHVVHVIDGHDRDRAVVNVLRQHEAMSSLVFCQTREGVSRLAAGLLERGFQAVAFSGELSQSERQRALQGVRDGRTRVLVCTDVAARGLDLPQVGLVIHADPPIDTAALMHRSGRTGRAGKKGTAVVLVPRHRVRQAERLFHFAKIKTTPTPAPTAEAIAAADEARIQERVKTAVAALEAKDLVGTEALLEHFTPEQLAALVLAAERRALPSPELLDQGRSRSRDARDGGRDGGRDGRDGGREGGRDAGPPMHGHGDDENIVWFHINVGRLQRADPKWLLPLLCRRGDVQKRDIGRIVIMPTETRFQIPIERAEHFERASSAHDPEEPRVFIRRFDPTRAQGGDRPARARDQAPLTATTAPAAPTKPSPKPAAPKAPPTVPVSEPMTTLPSTVATGGAVSLTDVVVTAAETPGAKKEKKKKEKKNKLPTDDEVLARLAEGGDDSDDSDDSTDRGTDVGTAPETPAAKAQPAKATPTTTPTITPKPAAPKATSKAPATKNPFAGHDAPRPARDTDRPRAPRAERAERADRGQRADGTDRPARPASDGNGPPRRQGPAGGYGPRPGGPRPGGNRPFSQRPGGKGPAPRPGPGGSSPPKRSRP
jgi:ATP-dependent RNA helicase DeaD